MLLLCRRRQETIPDNSRFPVMQLDSVDYPAGVAIVQVGRPGSQAAERLSPHQLARVIQELQRCDRAVGSRHDLPQKTILRKNLELRLFLPIWRRYHEIEPVCVVVQGADRSFLASERLISRCKLSAITTGRKFGSERGARVRHNSSIS